MYFEIKKYEKYINNEYLKSDLTGVLNSLVRGMNWNCVICRCLVVLDSPWESRFAQIHVFQVH
jgi:hypothetical protein